MNSSFRRRLSSVGTTPLVSRIMLGVVLTAPALSRITVAQEAVETTAPVDPKIAAIEAGVERGRAQLSAGDPSALQTLQATARQAAEALRLSGGNDLAGPTAAPVALRSTAAQAHFWWGRAEDTLGDRDRAITALSRALSFASTAAEASPSTPNETMAREARQRLNAILREGLPLVTPDDALETIAARVHGGLWQPRRSTFQLPPLSVRSSPGSAGRLAGRDVVAEVARSRELLITSGKVFPAQRKTADGSIRLWRTPPLYDSVKPTALPAALRMDRVMAGYIREVDGPNAGLWRLTVRVFYASPYLTRANRDDRPRAEILCEQFLRVAALMRVQTGLGNPYAQDGITTIWMAETSAWWPADDEEPAMAALLPMRQLPVNTALRRGEKLVPEVESSPLNRPWRAGAWLDSAPDELMLFKMTEPRSEAEWLRQLVHEYSHIALPPFAGFRPPLEPFGNGALGECLAMMWAAGNPAAFTPRDDSAKAPPAEAVQKMRGDLLRHVERNALPALRIFLTQGPNSPLSRSGTRDTLRYLQGLSVYLDRVYGSTALQSGFGPLSIKPRPEATSTVMTRRAVGASGGSITTSRTSTRPAAARVPTPTRAGYTAVVTANSLVQSSAAWLRNPFARGESRFAVWLPGALMRPSKSLNASDLAERAPLRLVPGERVSGWIFVPSAATALRIQGVGVAQLKAQDGWTSTPQPGPTSGAEGSLILSTRGRTGWQRLTLVATRDSVISTAWFERRTS